MSASPPAPNLSTPKLYTSSAIKSNPYLSAQITQLVNSAFYRSKVSSPGVESKWDNTRPRFESPDALHAMLSDERSVMAVIFDDSSSSPATSATESGEEEEGGEDDEDDDERLVVACAAAIPWAGGWHREGASTERGWEIKTICVHGDAKYLRKGLAVQLLGFLEEYLVRLERKALAVKGGEGGNAEGKVTLWILAADCINGVYWRKRGFEEVRRSTEGSGVWGCRTEFDMVVLKKEVRF
ncbi:hypothetical protein yc1106_06130 [Curvularia clavata]|uniref:Uncharacterized protein n=1 Tax=Curvularia clavata TaxID=95742 RepID=A0A9Q8ZAW8_CURCL|nr:hypothetical protein yc1106_06130 [Curvularia clavata]